MKAVSSRRTDELNGHYISGLIGRFLGVEQDVLAAGSVERGRGVAQEFSAPVRARLCLK
jgi:hypothetical protein